ncbi:MAG: aminoacyl-tRNA hydrolase [Candidatus Paceibacterota bacterium]|jgi:PTH1 family peptidyl-tRNA hydrolase
MEKANIKLIVGLGNPGKEYEKTYHNIGQLFVSWIMDHKTWDIKHRLFMASKIMLHDSGFMIHIVKPRTFMNESGEAVAAAMKYFKVKPAELLIVHDDSDVTLGKYKLSLGRGSAGHKGIESIIKNLGTKDFYRLRIGIRNPKNKAKASNLVLKKIKNQELLVLNKTFKEIFQNELIEL